MKDWKLPMLQISLLHNTDVVQEKVLYKLALMSQELVYRKSILFHYNNTRWHVSLVTNQKLLQPGGRFSFNYSRCEAPVLKFWGVWSILSLPIGSGSLWPGVIVSFRVPSMGKINRFKNHSYTIEILDCI